MRAKDIFTHPWVKGFEDQIKKRGNRSPERNKFDVIMRSPERTVKTGAERSPQRNLTKPEGKIQRSPERNEKVMTQKSPQRIREIDLPLKRDVKNSGSPQRTPQDLGKSVTKGPSNLIIQKEVKMNNNDIKRDNSAGPIDTRKKTNDKHLNIEKNEYNLLNHSSEKEKEKEKEKDIFNKVLDKVYIKNKGKKGNKNEIVDVDNLIKQDYLNNLRRRSLDPSDVTHSNNLLTDKNLLAKQLQEEDNKIIKNKHKLAQFKNDNERLETYHAEYRGLKDDDDDDDVNTNDVHKMKKDYYPKAKNYEIGQRSSRNLVDLSMNSFSITTDSNLNDEIYINYDNKRTTKRGSNYKISGFRPEITRE
jgi:hypothetical protein